MTAQCWSRLACQIVSKHAVSLRVGFKRLILCALLSLAPLAFSADIAGTWKSEKGPIWIEIDLVEGTGIIVRHDKFPERVGQVMLKALKRDSDMNIWRGEVYLQKRGEFRNVEVLLPEPNRMLTIGKMGFLSKSAGWLRVEKMPRL